MITMVTPSEAEELRLTIEGDMQKHLGDGCRVITTIKNGKLVFSLGGSIPASKVTLAIPGIFAYTINRYCRAPRNTSRRKADQRNLSSRNERHDKVPRL